MEKLEGKFAFMVPISPQNGQILTFYSVGGDDRVMNEDEYYAIPEFSEPVWSRHGINGRYRATQFIAEGEASQFPGDNYLIKPNSKNICFQEIFQFLNKSSHAYLNLYTAQNCQGFGEYDISELIINKMMKIYTHHKRNDIIKENILKEHLEFLLAPRFSNELNNLFHAVELEQKTMEKVIPEYACKIEAECMQNKRDIAEINRIMKIGAERAFARWDLPIRLAK